MHPLTPPPHASVPLGAAPLTKVTVGTSAASVAVILIWVAQTFLEIEMPPDVQEAFKTVAIALPVVVNFLGNYFTPLKYRELK